MRGRGRGKGGAAIEGKRDIERERRDGVKRK